MDQWPQIRRLPDGAIDYDFYRRKARAQRTVAIGDFFTLKRGASLRSTLMFLVLLRAVWKSQARRPSSSASPFRLPGSSR